MISINGLEKGKERYIICIDDFNEYAVLNNKKEFVEDDEDVCLYETLKEAEEAIYDIATSKNYNHVKIHKLISDGIVFMYSTEYWLKKYAYLEYLDNNTSVVKKEYEM